MGLAFGRKVRLYVGDFDKGNFESDFIGSKVQDLSDLDIEFEVYRSVRWYENEAQIVVYNPSPDTLNMLMTEGNSVVLQAGYENSGFGSILVSQIAMVVPKRVKRDIVVTITCLSSRGAFYQLARLHLATAFKKGTKVKDCLASFCDYAGIALRAGSNEELSKVLPYNYNYSGTFIAAILNFSAFVLEPYFNLKIFVDNNEMIILGKGNSIELEQVVLTHETGLLDAFKVRDETANKVNFGDDPKYYALSTKESDAPPKERPSRKINRLASISFTSLMNAALVPNGFVNIDSSVGDAYDSALAIKGRYVLTECIYRGGNIGSDFSVSCKALEAY